MAGNTNDGIEGAYPIFACALCLFSSSPNQTWITLQYAAFDGLLAGLALMHTQSFGGIADDCSDGRNRENNSFKPAR